MKDRIRLGRVLHSSKVLCTAVVVPALLSLPAPFSCLAAQDGGNLTIYTVNYPLAYFAERIAGENAEVVFPAPADVDPAFWVPDKKTIAEYQKADLIIMNGATYEKWMDKATLPQFRLVNTSAAFKEDYIKTVEGVTHSHGPDGEHSHSGTAFTTWLDFSQAARQARAIMDALVRRLPDEKKTFEQNFKALEEDLMALDEDISKIVSKAPDRPVIASHPIYQYFARRYGLNLESVMWEPGEFPADEQWDELEVGLRAHPARWMLWEGEPLEKSAKQLASMGVRSTVFAPCMNRPEDGDFLSIMKQNVENLRRVYQ